jgi:tryptophanase
MRDLVPLYEGFLTYGGMSVREIEAMAVGLEETLDDQMICQSPSFIEYFVKKVDALGIPVVTPAGALGAHIDAGQFLSHLPQTIYPAGALKWEKAPKVLRFFVGRLKAIGDWPERLMAMFRADFGDSL